MTEWSSNEMQAARAAQEKDEMTAAQRATAAGMSLQSHIALIMKSVK
jgi:hypothetical protein